MDAGYFYAPEMPLTQTPIVLDPETFQPRQGIITRYGRRITIAEQWGRPSDQPRKPLPKIDWRHAGF